MSDLAEREAAGHSGTKGARTRQRILDLGIERFGERGFRATSVSEIARAAGLTQAASYAYFDSKEALFRAAVDADAAALIGEVAARVDGTPTDRLLPSILAEAVHALADHPLARRVLAGQEPEEVGRLVELPAMALVGELIADRLARGQRTGEVRSDIDPTIVAAGIESLLVGLLFSIVQTGPMTARHEAGLAETFDLLLRPPDRSPGGDRCSPRGPSDPPVDPTPDRHARPFPSSDPGAGARR